MNRRTRSAAVSRNLVVLNHPALQRDLTVLRDRKTPSSLFRSTLDRCSAVLAAETSRDLKVQRVSVRTPLGPATGARLKNDIVLIPVLRAGLGMVEGFVRVFPEARVGHVGLYRDEESLTPVEYYLKVPGRLRTSVVYLLDPMLATGGSAVSAINAIRKKGGTDMRLVSLLAAPEGIKRVARTHPDVLIYTCSLDRRLNEKGYIVPGLGDAGDRQFGTE